MINKSGICIAIILAVAFSQSVFKNEGNARLAPRLLNYQGYLTDTLGNPITNPAVSMTFGIWSSSGGGTQLWYETQPISISKGIFSVLLGTLTPIPDTVFTKSVDRWLELTVAGITLAPRTRIVSVPYAYTATNSDTAAYARLLQGKDTTALDARYVNESQVNSIFTPMIIDTAVTMAKIARAGASTNQVIKWTGVAWQPATDVVGADADWNYLISDGADTTLQTGGRWGLARAGNVLLGNADSTHVNFGGACTTGVAGQNYKYCTVGGGLYNIAGNYYASAFGGIRNRAGGYAGTVGGGFGNTASGNYGSLAGGASNTASGDYSTVAGGYANVANNAWATVGGGYADSAKAYYGGVGSGYSNLAGDVVTDTAAVVAGGKDNSAIDKYTFVGGGFNNTASGYIATVSGGNNNVASYDYATVAGGIGNTAGAGYATVAGGGNNAAYSMLTTVGGGWSDTANGYAATVAGGYSNYAGSAYSTVGGGYNNTAINQNTTLSGGMNNIAGGNTSTVGGGSGNDATGPFATIAGGQANLALGEQSTIGGGYGDSAWATFSGVGSGWKNRAGDADTDTGATVAGGWNNSAIAKGAYVGGGFGNTASRPFASISGGCADSVKAPYGGVLSGYSNLAGDASSDTGAIVAGGWNNSALSRYAFVGGGSNNSASYQYATVAGGKNDTVYADYATVGGGMNNYAGGYYATVAGGAYNRANSFYATVSGGDHNITGSSFSTVSGGVLNYAGYCATVAGGADDTADGSYSFATGEHSVVPIYWRNSAAFNGTTASGDDQLRCYQVVQGFAGFAVDHPLDPDNKILNQYSMNSSEAVMFYRGSAMIGSKGRVDVQLPDYFDALNKNPMIQLTGVGTSDVYIAEDVSGNHFAIGGKPGTKVYWTVTGERKDVTAEICKAMTPVVQPKSGALAGRSLDDVGLIYGKDLLDKNGDGRKFQFRTEAGRKRHEDIKRMLQENGN
ncbi:MAG TPA: hypothetical protein VF399_06090 [bacterium]